MTESLRYTYETVFKKDLSVEHAILSSNVVSTTSVLWKKIQEETARSRTGKLQTLRRLEIRFVLHTEDAILSSCCCAHTLFQYWPPLLTNNGNTRVKDITSRFRVLPYTNEQNEDYRRNIMRQKKSSDSVLAQWIKTMMASSTVVEATETFTGVSVLPCEQHQQRDFAHTERFTDWLRIYNPFGRSGEHLLSISSGLVADDSINCDSAHEVGIAAIDRMTRNNWTYTDLQLKHKDKVTSRAEMTKSVLLRGQKVQINPNQLFHRILCQMQCGADEIYPESCLCYELTSLPPSLFDGHSLRNPGAKSKLISLKERKATLTDEIPLHPTFITNGGDPLNRVIWFNACTYKDVCNSYHAYLERNYGLIVFVVFDGYEQTTRDVEHMRCRARISSRTISVSLEAQPATMPSRQQQTQMLLGEEWEDVAAVGGDTDLLVLLIDLVPPSLNVYFMILGTKLASRKVFSIRILQTNLGGIKNDILFAHAMSGCNTTSAPYRVGKVKSFKKIEDSNIRKLVDPFNTTGISQDEVAAAGEAFMVCLYGGNRHDSLNITHLKLYMRIIGRKPTSANQLFDWSVLPPTTAASREHSIRVYLQMQLWRGVPLSPSEWAWKIVNGEHTPVPTLQFAAPEIIMKQMSCNYISDCERSCSCRRASLKCSSMCGHCAGYGCANAAEV
ncbi:hypothetical protein PR048_027011 [Dryococelus australis]|uniref:Tesmin/TSO1-like CXC domain-containing protein n=1 Tax=Dryococelus australis TaxID=614101 RepID=A0ABQ9GMW1_9NEOP|nr:hypothetical protein PR048_027011 [Dryococelus australis]